MRELINLIRENQLSEDAYNVDEFTRAYIEAALWSSTDESDDSGGEPLDNNYTIEEIADETRQEMIDDCSDFQSQANLGEIKDAPTGEHSIEALAGHDFWLTRNGHGAGFWDGDWPEPYGDSLTELSKTFGEVDLYVGDDGLIYQQ